jgi:hypothetical protein
MAEGTGEGTGTGSGTGAGEKPAWVAQLPADLKDNEAFTQYKTIGDLAKAHLEVSGKVKDLDGMKAQLSNSIPKPKPDAKPEEREAFYKALGRPDKPEDYEFEGTVDEATGKWAKDVFHKAGLSKEQAKLIQVSWNGMLDQMVKVQADKAAADRAAADTALKTELGGDQKFNEAVELGKRVIDKYFGKDMLALLANAKIDGVALGNHPAFVKGFMKLAKVTGEDTSPPGSPSPGQAKDELKTMYPNSPGMFAAKG